MDHQGMVDGKGAEHFLFMAKAEEILRYLRDIRKNFSWEDKKVLEDAENIITKMISERMALQEGALNQDAETQKSSDDISKLRYSH